MVPNAFFPDEVPSTPTEPFEKGPPPGAPYLLFLGRLSPQKAPEKIVKAFMEVADRFPELHLVLAGPDYGLRPLLCRMISASPLATRIWMPGMLSDAQKWPALKHASLMVLPSRNEGHSLSLLEAAAAGCPSLISRAAGFEELVDAGGAWFFDGSVADLTDKLRQRLVDREQLSEAGQSAQEFVSRRYTWEVRLPEWMSLYGPAT
jgi:glycosyltransferase involved in cell wall biosynthesis